MDTPLGKSIAQPKFYDPGILAAVPRSIARADLGIQANTFFGLDRWTAYEFFWFDQNNNAKAAILNIEIDCASENLVESKSLKLYLNSCYYRSFASVTEVQTEISHQISKIVQGSVCVMALDIEHPSNFTSGLDKSWRNIDEVKPSEQGELAVDESKHAHEKLYSNLFRSLCPVTAQPDWATVLIEYKGNKLIPEVLTGYLLNYAEHSGFHEACVESIYRDISQLNGIEDVAVCAKFLRRGGIDICPFRTSNLDFKEPSSRLVRQ